MLMTEYNLLSLDRSLSGAKPNWVYSACQWCALPDQLKADIDYFMIVPESDKYTDMTTKPDYQRTYGKFW